MSLEQEQKHYEEITEVIDKYDKTDRDFIMYYLLSEYIEDTQKAYDNMPYEVDLKSFALSQMYKRQYLAALEMRNILYLSIWS